MRQALYLKVNAMDVSRIRECFAYDPSVVGCLVNKIDRGKAKANHAAKVSLGSKGYLSITIDGKSYQGHRVVYALHHGEIPDGFVIDHIDGNKINNQITNLRLATKSQNQANRRKNRNGHWRMMKGITQVRPGYFRACISSKGKSFSKSSYDLGTVEAWLVRMREKLHPGYFRHN